MLIQDVLSSQLDPAPLHPRERLAGLYISILRVHVLPEPAVRLLFGPVAHPVRHLVLLVRPLLLRVQQQLVRPEDHVGRFRILDRLALSYQWHDYHHNGCGLCRLCCLQYLQQHYPRIAEHDCQCASRHCRR